MSSAKRGESSLWQLVPLRFTCNITRIYRINESCNWRITQRWGPFVLALLQRKGMGVTHSECVFIALVIQHANCTRRFLSSSAISPALQHLSTLSHTRRDFRTALLNIKRLPSFSLQILSETFLALKRIQRYIIINLHRSSCKASVILVRF